MRRRKNFGEYISELQMSRKISQLQNAVKNLVSCKMAINLNVLRSLVKNRIFCNLESQLIVAMESDWLFMRDAQFRKKADEPGNFSSSVGHNPIFSFSRALRNSRLFLKLPADGRIA